MTACSVGNAWHDQSQWIAEEQTKNIGNSFNVHANRVGNSSNLNSQELGHWRERKEVEPKRKMWTKLSWDRKFQTAILELRGIAIMDLSWASEMRIVRQFEGLERTENDRRGNEGPEGVDKINAPVDDRRHGGWKIHLIFKSWLDRNNELVKIAEPKIQQET